MMKRTTHSGLILKGAIMTWTHLSVPLKRYLLKDYSIFFKQMGFVTTMLNAAHITSHTINGSIIIVMDQNGPI